MVEPNWTAGLYYLLERVGVRQNYKCEYEYTLENLIR
jgi:hypothetical protein